MIDLRKAEKEFLSYTSQYDIKDDKIAKKRGHSLRVEKISKEIIKRANKKEEEIKLGALIGLLHDIGRFDQESNYHTFKDWQSIDHGDYGVKILLENNRIRNYIKEDTYDAIILKAIKNHNKYQIEKGLSEKEQFFAEVIRDADKLDIFYEILELFWKDNTLAGEEISEEVIKQIQNKTPVDNKTVKTDADDLIKILALSYDMYQKESYQMLAEKQYISKIVNKFDYQNKETETTMKALAEEIEKYIEEKANS